MPAAPACASISIAHHPGCIPGFSVLPESGFSISRYDNLINGQWTAAAHYAANTNPSDL